MTPTKSATSVIMPVPKRAQIFGVIAKQPAPAPVPAPRQCSSVFPVASMPRAKVDIDVYAIRQKATGIGYTQETFADAIGVPVKTVRNWEQGRRRPTGPARVLLSLIARNPMIVVETLKNRPATPVA